MALIFRQRPSSIGDLELPVLSPMQNAVKEVKQEILEICIIDPLRSPFKQRVPFETPLRINHYLRDAQRDVAHEDRGLRAPSPFSAFQKAEVFPRFS